MLNIERAIKLALKEIRNPLIQAVVLGSSGAGKSSLLGTFGVKTLLLYGTGESHSGKAAHAFGGDNIIPVCFDYGTPEGEKIERYLTPDEAIKSLRSILQNHDLLRQLEIKAIAVDGLAVLERLVKETDRWKSKCLTAQGKHNTFKETEASLESLSAIIDDLKIAQKMLDVHIAMTCMLDVKDLAKDGSIMEASPRLAGYMLAEGLIQQFSDVLVVGKISRTLEGKQVTKYKLQFMSDLSKASKDETGELKRAMNFNPRVSGVANLPALIDADLSQLIKLKNDAVRG